MSAYSNTHVNNGVSVTVGIPVVQVARNIYRVKLSRHRPVFIDGVHQFQFDRYDQIPGVPLLQKSLLISGTKNPFTTIEEQANTSLKIHTPGTVNLIGHEIHQLKQIGTSFHIDAVRIGGV